MISKHIKQISKGDAECEVAKARRKIERRSLTRKTGANCLRR